MTKLENNHMLCFVNDNQINKYSSINYYRVLADIGTDNLRKVHSSFESILGEYKVNEPYKIPLIQRRIVDSSLNNQMSSNGGKLHT